MYRVRMASLCGTFPPFYSTAVRQLKDAALVVHQLDKVVHDATITVQTSETPGRCGRWTTMDYSQWASLLPHVSISEGGQ